MQHESNATESPQERARNFIEDLLFETNVEQLEEEPAKNKNKNENKQKMRMD